jgi:hypothetical protein
MKKKLTADLFSTVSIVPVNEGRLLEDNLKKWQGGSQHIRGIGEYITNSDDSYRRMKKFSGKEIFVEIHSIRKNGKQLDKVLSRDNAEGMSYDDLENKFFRYFESHSGRTEGKNVTGQYGTGGKAYAIMNFKECWITSVKNGKENKAWFKWDGKAKHIMKGYNGKGYIDKKVDKSNGTTIELIKSANHINLLDFVIKLNSLARIRHVIKSQKVKVAVVQGDKSPEEFLLEYDTPKNHLKVWKFFLPDRLKNTKENNNEFVLRYFEKPLDMDSFIDLSDGISTVADLEINKYDNRPFAKYLNGELTIEKLQSSSAVRENRKGLEEGDDLTIEIEDFLREKIKIVINEIQEMQREKEKERSIATSNEKINELNKFLKKCELNFKNEISSLHPSTNEHQDDTDQPNLDGENIGSGFMNATDEDEDIVYGKWKKGDKPILAGSDHVHNDKFNPDDNDDDTAIEVLDKPQKPQVQKKQRRGLIVLMTDDENSPVEQDEYGEFEEPVIDKYLKSDGLILINANNPIISKSRTHQKYQHIFNERVANYVLLVVAQFQAQRELDLQQEDERDDPMQIFRQRYFRLQRDLRDDKDIGYYNEETENVA